MTTHVFQFPCLSDNYGALIHDSGSGRTAAIDAPDGAAVIAAAQARGWKLTDLLVTHHHADHVQGIPAVRAAFPGLRVVGPAKEAARIGGLDVEVGEGDLVEIGALAARVIETPGHTAGQVNYLFEEDEIVFTGDTLFSLGCGRVFETPLAVMWSSLAKLAALPGETQVYCGHEYTEANARFALSIEPGNADLLARAEAVKALRAKGQPTLPTTIALELATNPFLRAEIPAVQKAVGLEGADPAQVFAEIRRRKDSF
ncbi:MAG: hydroxyacylglutathione hydrolase [Pseudomonadota bacterium]|nr:hydroxyacylglutathione hydrolase [Pseudomonadota bacterium]